MADRLVTAYETVNLLADGPAATIELNRPDTLNAWNRQFAADLLASIRRSPTILTSAAS